jgi:hypothetical protein
MFRHSHLINDTNLGGTERYCRVFALLPRCFRHRFAIGLRCFGQPQAPDSAALVF